MARYQVAYVVKTYMARFLEADDAQDAWNKVKNGEFGVSSGGIIEVHEEVESLTSIQEVTELTVDINSLTL